MAPTAASLSKVMLSCYLSSSVFARLIGSRHYCCEICEIWAEAYTGRQRRGGGRQQCARSALPFVPGQSHLATLIGGGTLGSLNFGKSSSDLDQDDEAGAVDHVRAQKALLPLHWANPASYRPARGSPQPAKSGPSEIDQ